MELTANCAAAILAVSLLIPMAPPAVAAASAEPPAADSSAERRLMQLFADDAAREEKLDPLDALYRGEPVDPATLALLFTAELDRRSLASARRSLDELARIDRAQLGPERRISYDVFAGDKREAVAFLQPDVLALTAVRPFNHFGGLHVEFPSLMAHDGSLPYRTTQDYRRALALEAAFPRVLDTALGRFRQGIASGVVESQLTVGNMIAQIDALLAQPVEKSPFYSPVLNFPNSVREADRAELRREFRAVVEDEINPAYRRLRTFLADEYMPAARETVGISTMRGGPGLYRMLIAHETTLKLEPDAVHALGLAEVARIQREMETVKTQLGGSGPLRTFFEKIRTDPRFHPATAEELERGFARIAADVELQIPRYFARVPATPLVIRPYPSYRAQYEAGGSYSEGSLEAKRPGVFYFNTYDLPSRFLTGMATLYLHEGAPGHHFQISLAQEDKSLPAFQRFGGNNAFIEGWALYAETLGYDMGFYKDPRQHWGTLDDEMLRAMRLVVDTGIHAKGWSREQAIDYMLANSGMGRTDATSEVDRYIANPAQALGYKIGALTIQRLRREAEAALGARFDIRAFHAQVLGSGALPLPVLEAKIRGWIAAQR